ncbi:hypothetical protein PHSY_006507 [Pseudozyma hubeiensis SY62]|uniref:Uncharacterized protein n=1 Tax=Pseudozyma hubeiensis (strain SY62) TaxID=1305764 RepID=R9PCG5_PSEHS|nr:hypothetical protein PHSY_006507 [Pseudozyma hubeiensis SY62]GAC98912.1 hypothetical protein PHSY_006507 [Pseudozyma hubeiensis SY62]
MALVKRTQESLQSTTIDKGGRLNADDCIECREHERSCIRVGISKVDGDTKQQKQRLGCQNGRRRHRVIKSGLCKYAERRSRRESGNQREQPEASIRLRQGPLVNRSVEVYGAPTRGRRFKKPQRCVQFRIDQTVPNGTR